MEVGGAYPVYMRRDNREQHNFSTMDIHGCFDSKEAEKFNKAKNKRKEKFFKNREKKHEKWDRFD